MERDAAGVSAGAVIHELFEEQVRRDAGSGGGGVRGKPLTYAELNARANQLARYLREQGSGTGSAGGDLRGAQPGDGGGVAGDPEGGRGVCAAGSGLSGGAAGVHAGGCAPGVLLTQEQGAEAGAAAGRVPGD